MSLIVWTRNFLKSQGLTVTDNVVFQDNQSSILLETNGRSSSGRRTRHIDIRYFFVADRVQNGELRIQYCPTDDMNGDFFTKPLQGSKFRRFRQTVLNSPPDVDLYNQSASQECVGKPSYADVVCKGVPTGERNPNPTKLKRIRKNAASPITKKQTAVS
jgi:hypothetical protein